MPGQMIRQRRHAPGEDQPFGIDAAQRRLHLQIGCGGGAVLTEPKHAAGHCGQDPHPAIEHGRRDLVEVVEAAEHDTVLGKPAFSPGEHRLRYGARCIVRLIAVRKIRNLFREIALLRSRDDGSIGDDVVDEISATRAGITEIADLDRCRPLREDVGAAVPGEAVQVDQDVDLRGPDHLRNLDVAEPRAVEECSEGAFQPPAHRRLIGGTDRYCRRVKPRPVVMFEHPGRQLRYGMVLKI